MNKRFLMLTVLSLSLFWQGCSDDDTEVMVADLELAPANLVSSVDQVDLNPELASNPALTLTWDDADYGVQTVIFYDVLMSLNQDMSDSVVLANRITDRSITWSIRELNSAALNNGVPAATESTVYFQVASSLGAQGDIRALSNAIGISMSPFITYTFTDLYLVGPASSAGWNNDNNNPVMFRSPEDEDVFSYTGFLNQDQLKMLEQRGAWAPQYGLGSSAGSLFFRQSEDVMDPPPIDITSAGYKTVSVNIGTLTYSVVDYDASSAPTYSSVGIIGDSTPSGWDADTDMTPLDNDPHIWYYEGLVLNNGEAKFRADDDWAVNWGGNTQYSGVATQDGPNIPVTAGVYRVWFNDLTGEYMMIPID